MKIVAIDDYRDNLWTIFHILENSGHEVILHDEVKEACEACFDADMVFMDICLPGMNGFEATENILKENPLCYIVALTGNKNSEFHMESLRIGMREFISKPFDANDINSAVSRANREIAERLEA